MYVRQNILRYEHFFDAVLIGHFAQLGFIVAFQLCAVRHVKHIFIAFGHGFLAGDQLDLALLKVSEHCFLNCLRQFLECDGLFSPSISAESQYAQKRNKKNLFHVCIL